MALVEMIASTAQLQGDIMTEADKKELQDIVKDLIIQSDFTVDANEKISHLMTTVTMKNKIIDEDILNGSFTMSLATSPNIHPILVPETSHDMSKIASDF